MLFARTDGLGGGGGGGVAGGGYARQSAPADDAFERALGGIGGAVGSFVGGITAGFQSRVGTYPQTTAQGGGGGGSGGRTPKGPPPRAGASSGTHFQDQRAPPQHGGGGLFEKTRGGGGGATAAAPSAAAPWVFGDAPESPRVQAAPPAPPRSEPAGRPPQPPPRTQRDGDILDPKASVGSSVGLMDSSRRSRHSSDGGGGAAGSSSPVPPEPSSPAVRRHQGKASAADYAVYLGLDAARHQVRMPFWTSWISRRSAPLCLIQPNLLILHAFRATTDPSALLFPISLTCSFSRAPRRAATRS